MAQLERIGVLTSCYPRYEGDLAAHFVEGSLEALRDLGVRADVVAPHESGVPERERKRDIDVRRFRYLFPESLERVAYGSGTLANLRSDWRAALGLPFFVMALAREAKRMARGGCPLIHAHWIPSGIALARQRGRDGPALVVSIWGSDLRLARRSAWIRSQLAGADRIVAVSEAMRDDLVALGLPENRLAVIKTAITPPATRFRSRPDARRELGLPERTTLLYLGRLSLEKGPDVLLSSLASGLLDETNSQLVFVGDGVMESRLRDEARAISPDRIRFAGVVAHERVADWLSAADALVLPSRSEGLPHALLEAISVGLPVVASHVGGIPEVVRDGETGYVTPPGDALKLQARLRELLKSETQRRAMGEAAQAFFEASGFTWKRVGAELLSVYDAALAERNAARTADAARSSQSN